MLKLKPITFKKACEFVASLHRHHKPPRGHKFSISCVDNSGDIRGVVMVGRPVARCLDDGFTAEVNRLCTDGTKNACSILYAAAARAAKAMGYTWIVTYILESESGTSLKASGWTCDGKVRVDGKGWNNRKGRKTDNQEPKERWHKFLI